MTFAFHANTLAFGGQVEESGRTKYLPSQASVTLPPSGGIGETRVDDYNDGNIAFLSATSYVSGDNVADTSYNTYANVTVSKLDIGKRVQINVLNTIVKSENERIAGCVGESSITFGGDISGLVIDGHVIKVNFDFEPFARNGKYADFVNSFTTLSEAEVREYAEAYNWDFNDCHTVTDEAGVTVTRFHVPRNCTTGIRASLVRSTTPKLTRGEIVGIERKGFTIEVAGLGLLHLGEVLLKTGRRRVNMLRVELNKKLDGSTMSRASLRDAGGEPRLEATGVTTEMEPLMLVAALPPGGGGGGGYTFASGEGNGTDFLP
jgi:hypothetical protein